MKRTSLNTFCRTLLSREVHELLLLASFSVRAKSAERSGLLLQAPATPSSSLVVRSGLVAISVPDFLCFNTKARYSKGLVKKEHLQLLLLNWSLQLGSSCLRSWKAILIWLLLLWTSSLNNFKLTKFMDANVSLVPNISSSSSFDPFGLVDRWPSQEGKLEQLYSPEAYEMVENHQALILENRVADSKTIAQMSKL
ncbi:hypothetical protein NE237_024017 [Protea cynaroides]|uniref:Uncharacterized protein n=1 Tax=Protea cynaroides TaxID=273540 RepID=A0A9Q0HD72_9MAGN|nr:hypothetical protein NE237_024017 [Protea cynaroides]